MFDKFFRIPDIYPQTEVRLQLGIRSSHVAQCWRQTIMATADAENEITGICLASILYDQRFAEELLSRDEAAYRSVHKNSSRLCWKPSAKRDVLSRRLSFEMTQTSALKHKEVAAAAAAITVI